MFRMSRVICVVLGVVLPLLIGSRLRAQTTESVIRGRIVDASTGKPIDGTRISYYNPAVNDSGETHTDASGYYVLTSLPAGNYRIRIERQGYQSRDLYGLDLFVASALELNADLHSLSETFYAAPGGFVLPRNQGVVLALGPDFELGRSTPLDVPVWTSATLQSALSYAIDPQQLGELPLAARNVYTMIITLPGVTAEQATGRGLGLAVNGQRPSSSNFLLDGAENNDYILTGPFSTIPPEGVQEYRVTTNDFSAEYGRSGGFVANAITRAGANSWHGLAYAYINNDVLNAATFLQKANDIRKTPEKELEAGYSLGGAIRKDRLFFSSALDRYRSRSLGDPELWIVPIVDNFRACAVRTGADFSAVLNLFAQFPPPPAFFVPPAASPCNSILGNAQLARPVSIDRTTALERLDYRPPGGAQRFLVRLTGLSLTQPDQEYNVYSAFRSDMIRRSGGVAVTYTRSLSAAAFNQVRASYRNAAFEFQRPGGAAPGLFLLNGGVLDIGSFLASLPGSAVPYGMTSHENDWELADYATLARGPHVLSAGGGLLLRRQNLNMPLLSAPWFGFSSLTNFALGGPTYYVLGVSREGLQSGNLAPADPHRHYSNNEFYAFAQDSWRVTSRFTLNLGIRYESFGNLQNTGTPDAVIQLGPGGTIEQRLHGASLVFPHGGEALYPASRNNWAGRFGAAYNLSRTTVLRAGYGVFYDRLYDNLFLNPFNSTAPATFCVQTSGTGSCAAGIFDYTQPVSSLLSGHKPAPQSAVYQSLLWVDPGLRTPYVQNWFAGVQQHVTNRWYVEVSHMGGLGRKLISNDIVNRPVTLDNPAGRINPGLPDLNYRSNSGSSDYTALGALAHYRSALADLQVSYTWSHSIDNQSDPLLLDPFSLNRFNPEDTGAAAIYSKFSRQFDSRIDRGGSDFDIRHSLVFYSIWRLPGPRRGWIGHLAGGWQLSQLASIRTGLPYAVLFNAGDPDQQTRPNLVPGVRPEMQSPAAGGVQVLNRNAFALPSSGSVGNLGRNSFTGPGFWNLDFSLAKSFPIRRLSEATRVQIRADAFNLLNHANLSQPEGNLSSPGFGTAYYGPPLGSTSAFPAVTPLYPTARRIQLQAKFYF
jgi:hypothetical protein